jgi:hypothetical protein
MSVIERTRIPLRRRELDDALGRATERASFEPQLLLNLLNWDWIWWILRMFRWHRLDFSMQHQQQTNWCWAAVSTSVSLFFQPSSGWTQCAVANGELNRNDCCSTGASGPCNVYGFLDTSLTRVGHLDHATAATSTFSQIETEINGGRPLGVRTAWSGGGAHFLAIIGYRIFNNLLAVDDPFYGKSDVGLSTFTSSYQGAGSWTQSYFTRA